MITLLIVDDEKNIRAGIHKILSEAISYEIRFLEAKNGQEALELIEQENPDLMITDIRMPKMDGVELMQLVSAKTVRPDIIVLSGFDEFSYAKEAIKSGAISYILKPVDKNELIAVVTAAVTKIERTKKSTVEQTIQRVMSEGRMLRTTVPGKFFSDAPFYFIMITGLGNPDQMQKIVEKNSCYLLERKSESLCILVHESEMKTLEGYHEDDGVFIGISGVCKSLANLRTSWRQAAIASFTRFFETEKKVFHYQEASGPFDRTGFDSQIQKINMLIGSGDASEITRGIDDLFLVDFPEIGAKARYVYFLQDFITTGVIKKYWEYADADMYLTLKSIMIENVYQFRSIEEYKKTVLDYVLYLNSTLKKSHTEYPFISEALEYIRGHFTEEINMTIVANHVSINYTYFSEKFKEHTGVNFNDFLKKLRIEEAKRLLEKGCYKVYEVSANSGFGDVKYFMKTFKETTGLSPGEYRKKF